MVSGNEVSVLIAFSAGVLSFLSPCILPLFPSYITYITGRSFEDMKSSGKSSDITKLTVINSLFFILGFSIVFVLLGITLSYLGSFFGIKRLWLEKAGGILIVLFGLNMTGLFKIGFLNRGSGVPLKRKKIGYLGTLLVGMIFAFGWTPCVGPILSSILIYASALKSLPAAAMLLLFYSIGLGVPFLISGLAINQFLALFAKLRNFMRFIPIVSGAFLILMGVTLFLGQFSRIAGLFAR
ncbi:MAG: cytochrome c biogenesis protein CcdA [Candidatus Omnitrophica bacterium]|nr:cytochrome c biogenesis protein CcdA [Candidatus Omnitrophota bacterium]